MAAITEKFTAKEDVTVFSIDGSDVLAIFQTGTINISRDEIDVSAAQDSWKQRENGTADWSVDCSKLVKTSPIFLDSIVDGGLILVSISTTGMDFLGTGMLTTGTLNIDNPMTEDCTVVSAGAAPTITI
jgi:hypothetical protein